MTWAINGKKDYVKKSLERSLKKLNTDYIDLYYLHRLDKNTPIEETVEAMAGLGKEGKVGYIGLSEVSSETVKRAHAANPNAGKKLLDQNFRPDSRSYNSPFHFSEITT